MRVDTLFEYIRSHPLEFQSGTCTLHGYSDQGFSVHEKKYRRLITVGPDGCTECPKAHRYACVHAQCTNSLAMNKELMKNLKHYVGILNTDSGY